MRHLGATAFVVAFTLAAGSLRAQETQIHFFTDVTGVASDDKSDHWAFGLGQYDFFVTAHLADHISFLGESVFEFDGDFVVDVERLIISFAPKKYLRVEVGKQHTPFGYWNTAYHHGTVLQPTIERPTMFLFEDDGGPLPVHTTGLMVDGEDITPFHLGYDILIGNGIGGTPISDNNNAKSYTLALHSQVTSALRIGASAYFDRITAGTPSLDGTPVAETVDRRMVGGFAVYLGPTYELMGEFQHAVDDVPSAPASKTDLSYVYGGYRFDKFVPYVRWDRIHYGATDPYFIRDNLSLVVLGARYDLAATTTVKLEYHRRDTQSGGVANEVAAQVAVGF
jgi:hypothetical protein